MVKVIFYAPRSQIFSGDIAFFFPWCMLQPIKLITVHARHALISSVGELNRDRVILILAASSNTDLEELISLKEMFLSLPTILILPDDSLETLQKGMLLNPVYFMTIQDDFCHVSDAVMNLNNIYIQHYNPQKLSSTLN